MTPISSGATILVRWLPWLIVLGTAAWVPLQTMKEGDGASDLLAHWWALVALALAGGFHYLTTWKLVDAFFDCGGHLLVRRGKDSVRIPLQEIAAVRLGLHLLGDRRREVVLELKETTVLGCRVQFLPINTKLPAAYARVGVANHLQLRVERAARNAA